MDKQAIKHYLNNLMTKYDTGWINCADWTDQHLGSVLGGNVEHNLDAVLDQLIIRVYVSVDVLGAGSFEVGFGSIDGIADYGFTIYYIDNNTIKVQTGANGLIYYSDNGTGTVIDTENWFYKIVLFKINCREY